MIEFKESIKLSIQASAAALLFAQDKSADSKKRIAAILNAYACANTAAKSAALMGRKDLYDMAVRCVETSVRLSNEMLEAAGGRRAAKSPK